MKKRIIRIVILLFYCIPFTFLAINADAKSGTLIFYGVMLVGLLGACCAALKIKNIPIIYIGNALSFISSYIATKASDLQQMSHYFKPFTLNSIIVVLSVLAVIFQTILVLIHLKKNRK